jgi:hypothetical protein
VTSASFSHSAAISLRIARDSRSVATFASCRQWVAKATYCSRFSIDWSTIRRPTEVARKGKGLGYARKPPVMAWLPIVSQWGFASGVGAGASGSGVGVAPRSSGAATQSPAQSLVPLTVLTSLQPVAARGFTCAGGLPPTLGAPV